MQDDTLKVVLSGTVPAIVLALFVLICFHNMKGELSIRDVLYSYPYRVLFLWLLVLPALVWLLFVVEYATVPLLNVVLQPRYFLLQLSGLFGCWLYCRAKPPGLLKTLADWSKPLLIGMGAIGAISLAANLWIPKAQWVWLFQIEEVAYTAHSMLNTVLPKALWAKLAIVAGILCVGLALPELRPWLKRFDKAITLAKAGSAVLAMFVSMTLFGDGQSGEIGQSVADEKYKRVEAQATAVAHLTISARLTEDSQAESQATAQWLDAIVAGVRADLNVLPMLLDPERLSPARQALLRDLIKKRAAELGEAIAKRPVILDAEHAIDTRLAGILRRHLTEQDRSIARAAFEKALSHFTAEVAKVTGHPITALLEEAGAPELGQDLVKELYEEEVKRTAKIITEPLTDVRFRPAGSPEANTAAARISDVARRPVFEPETLPPDVVHPTGADRIHRTRSKINEREVFKIVRGALKKVQEAFKMAAKAAPK